MSKPWKSVFVTLVLASPVPALANWMGPYPVKYIESRQGNVFFMLDWTGNTTYTPGLPGCNNSTIFFPASLPAKEVDRAFAIGLAAQATGARVRFYVTGCNNGYMVADSIAIDPNW